LSQHQKTKFSLDNAFVAAPVSPMLHARTLSVYAKSDFAAKAAYRGDRSVYACTYPINSAVCTCRVRRLSR